MTKKKKTKTFNFLQKQFAQDKKFLSENLKANTKLKNMKTWYNEQFSDKNSSYIDDPILMIIFSFFFFYSAISFI